MSGPAPAPRRHIRLVFAIAVASLLGTFAVYTAFANDSTPLLGVAQAAGGQHQGQTIRLTGTVVSATGNASGADGLRFVLRDDDSHVTASRRIAVVYHGAVPDAFKVGRHVVVDGRLEGGRFAAKDDTLVTKCPSKYQDRPASTTGT